MCCITGASTGHGNEELAVCEVRVRQIDQNPVEVISLDPVDGRRICQAQGYLVANDGLWDSRELELEADGWKVPDGVGAGSGLREANGDGQWPEFNDAGKGTFDEAGAAVDVEHDMDRSADLEMEAMGRDAGGVDGSGSFGQELGSHRCRTVTSFRCILSGVCVDVAGEILQQCSVVGVSQGFRGADDSRCHEVVGSGGGVDVAMHPAPLLSNASWSGRES